MIGDLSVVFQSFRTIRLVVEAGHRYVTDLQKLRRSEKGHVRGVVVNRVHDASLVHQHGTDAAILQLDPAGQPGRAGPYHQNIDRFGHSLLSMSLYAAASAPSRADTSLPPASAISGLPPPLPPTA